MANQMMRGYDLPGLTTEFKLTLPKDAVVVQVARSHNGFRMWATHNPDIAQETREVRFRWVLTNEVFVCNDDMIHVESMIVGGKEVHLFEYVEKDDPAFSMEELSKAFGRKR